jgi:hypothetical protein
MLFLKLDSGFKKFMLEIYISFWEVCISNTGKKRQASYNKAAVPSSNPPRASISKLAA